MTEVYTNKIHIYIHCIEICIFVLTKYTSTVEIQWQIIIIKVHWIYWDLCYSSIRIIIWNVPLNFYQWYFLNEWIAKIGVAGDCFQSINYVQIKKKTLKLLTHVHGGWSWICWCFIHDLNRGYVNGILKLGPWYRT